MKKQLSTVKPTRFEIEKISRRMAYEAQREAVKQIMKFTFTNPDGTPLLDETGDMKKPNGAGLMISFNKAVKDSFGYSCDEIDQIEDAYLCNAVRALREDFILIMNYYIQHWKGSMDKYSEMKRLLRELPVSAKESYIDKLKRLRSVIQNEQ